MSYRVSTQGYSGPFDLLLQLVTRQKVDIGSISIAEVAEQYLAEVERIEALDLDVASDFCSLPRPCSRASPHTSPLPCGTALPIRTAVTAPTARSWQVSSGLTRMTSASVTRSHSQKKEGSTISSS